MAKHAHTTPAPLGDRYVPAVHPVTVRFYPPQPDRRRRRLVAGVLKGAMHMRGSVHHYRVAGEDGVLYLAPAAWFTPQHVQWFEQKAFAPPALSDVDRLTKIFALVAARLEQEPAYEGTPA